MTDRIIVTVTPDGIALTPQEEILAGVSAAATAQAQERQRQGLEEVADHLITVAAQLLGYKPAYLRDCTEWLTPVTLACRAVAQDIVAQKFTDTAQLERALLLGLKAQGVEPCAAPGG